MNQISNAINASANYPQK